MTPKQFLCIQKQQQSIINEAQRYIDAARAKVDNCQIPKRVRKATPRDLVAGAIIWHKQPKWFGPNYWNIVARGSNMHSYKAEDGNFYYIDGNAFVEE